MKNTNSARGLSHGPSRFGRQNRRPNQSQKRHSNGPSKRRGFKGDYINENLFIKKAEKAAVKKYEAKHVFADFGLHERLLANVIAKGYENPTPIQDAAIPLAMQNKDIIGIANTGTGKTAAFLLPLINKIMTTPRHMVMVLAPTRELAQQIEKEFIDFTRNLKMYSVTVVGGAPAGRQMRELEMGVDIIIGTPGRVKDLINRGKIKMHLIGSIVLDEADRMLDMGFINDIREILEKMPADRQGLFFSATFPPAIKTLCYDFLKNPEIISVKTGDTAANVHQDVVRSKGKDKIEMLHDILNRPECAKVLIFREMKRSVDDLGRELVGRGFKALALHGDMNNRERERAVKALAAGAVQIVIATDVAARGIDIPDITHVINYDIPSTYDVYVHRIGRTGRGSQSGVALTFV